MPFLHRRRRCPRLAADSAARTILNGYRPLVLRSAQSRYTGQWSMGQRSGFGTDSAPNGFVYDGNFRSDKRNGFGTLRRRLANGDYRRIYVGEWRDGRRHGEGKQFYGPDGRDGVYWGHWENGVRSGLGCLWLAAEGWPAYVGEWRDDRYEGAGVLFQANRNRYEGMFRAGLKHGEGTFYHLHTGQIQKGIWLDDQCVTSIMQDESRSQCMRPTPYPILKNLLHQPDTVVRNAFRHVMDSLRDGCPPNEATASICPLNIPN